MLQNNQKELILLKDLGYLYPLETSITKRKYGIYKCYCGKEFRARIDHVKSKSIQSCGCNSIQKKSERFTTHGLAKHRLYGIWKMMIQRCTNPKHKAYMYYGENEITVCRRWLDVANFIEDMYPTFIEGLTIDRINNNGNYEPSNCRWASQTIQSRNTRKIKSNNSSGYRGVGLNKKTNKFESYICINNKKIYLGLYKTALEAAKIYDQYIIDNNLEHTQNGVI